MGISTYNSKNVHGFIKDDELAYIEFQNGPEVQIHLELKALEFIQIAIEIFKSHSRHDSRPPQLYAESFSVESALHRAVRSVEVWNHDRTAEWVEFGSHAGGETPILRYRIFGRTSDILETIAEGE